MDLPENVVDLPRLRERESVFRDRADAGAALAELLNGYRDSSALVLAIPAGGVPVAAVIAQRLQLPLDLAVVSKITLPWNTESGYGAVAFDGTARLNEELLPYLGLSRDQIDRGIAATRDKVDRRVRMFRQRRPMPALADRPAIVVDDGLASGFTMVVAVEALECAGAREIVVAIPTGHLDSVRRLAPKVKTLYCANVRGGRQFAVASAYERWNDVSELDAAVQYAGFSSRAGARKKTP
jgi:predicted phosphoribosyltransferase